MLDACDYDERAHRTLLSTATACRKSRHMEHAVTALHLLQQTVSADRSSSASAEQKVLDFEWRVEEAKLLWALGRPELALRAAKGLLSQTSTRRTTDLRVPQLKILLGKWQSQQRCAFPS